MAVFMTLATSAETSSDTAHVPLTGLQIKQTIQKALQKMGYDSDPVVNSDRKYKHCILPLRVYPMFNQWSTVEISCPDQNGWSAVIRTRTNNLMTIQKTKDPTLKWKQIIIANKSLSAGHILSAKDLEISEVDDLSSPGTFKRVEDLLGRKVKTPISTGMSIKARHLLLDWVVEKNDKITIVSGKNAIQIIVEGNALDNGQKGEKIRVQNLSSGKILYAWVINENKVSTRPNILAH